MKRALFLVTAGLVALTWASLETVGQTNFWSGDGTNLGGSGVWDTTNPRFGTSTGGPFNLTWADTPTFVTNVVSFRGTPGNVTIQSGGLQANRIEVAVGGYTFSGGVITSSQSGAQTLITRTFGAAATVTFNNNFILTTNGNLNIPIRNLTPGLTNPLVLGGTFLFTDGAGIKRIDLDSTATGRVDVTGGLLHTPGATVQFRVGNNAGAGGNLSVYNFSGNSTHNGGLLLVRGIVNVSSASAIGTGQVQFATLATATNDTLRFFVSGPINMSNPFVVSGPASTAIVTSVLGKDVGDASTSTLSGFISLANSNNNLEIRVTDAAARLNITGEVTDGAIVRGFNKTGNGTLNLARLAGNTYDGPTIVNAGTLLVNNTSGSGTGTGGIQLHGGTTLGGTGILAGIVTTLTNTATIAPGNDNIGKLTVGGADWTQGVTLRFELGLATTPGVTYDQLVITNVLTGPTGTGNLQIALTNSGSVSYGVPYTLFTFATQSGFDYGDVNFLSLPAQLDPNFGNGGMLITSSGFQVQFLELQIPEPSVLTLLGGGGLVFYLQRRIRFNRPPA